MYDYVVMGASGLLGKSFLTSLKDSGAKVLALTSANFYEYSEKNVSCKYFINANGNSYRFKANNKPFWDFDKSVYSLLESLKSFKSQKYIYFSSIDVYFDKSNPLNNHEETIINPTELDYYGNNKYIAECILKKYHSNFLIFRLGSVVSPLAKKGSFYDLSQNKIHINEHSYLSIVDIENIHKAFFTLEKNNESNQVFNLTSSGNIYIKNIIDKFKIVIPPEINSSSMQLVTNNISNKKISAIVDIDSSLEIAERYFNCIKSVDLTH